METTHSTCTDIVPGCTYILYTRILPIIGISNILLKPEWAQEQDGITGKS